MELKSKEEIASMTLGEKRVYLEELKQYREQLVASKGLREQGAGLKRASETMMKYNPTGAFDLMDKAAQTEIDRKRVEQQGLNKTRKAQLEQLWKDNTRALTQARKDQESPEVIKKYEDNIAAIETQLKEIDPDTWGASVGGGTGGTKENVEKAVAEGKELVKKAVDVTDINGVKGADGIIDNIALLESTISDLRTKYGISSSDLSPVLSYLESRKDEISKGYESKGKKEDKAFEQAMKKRSEAGASWSIQLERAKQAYNDLKANPSDFSYRNEALDVLLRNETGAAIAKQETMNRLATLLPPSESLNMQESVGGVTGFLASRFQADETFTANLVKNYLGKVDINRVLKQLNLKAGGKASSGKAPSGKNTEGGLKLPQKTTKLPEGVTYEVIK